MAFVLLHPFLARPVVFTPTAAGSSVGPAATQFQSGMPISELPADERASVIEAIRQAGGSLESTDTAAATLVEGFSGSRY